MSLVSTAKQHALYILENLCSDRYFKYVYTGKDEDRDEAFIRKMDIATRIICINLLYNRNFLNDEMKQLGEKLQKINKCEKHDNVESEDCSYLEAIEYIEHFNKIFVGFVDDYAEEIRFACVKLLKRDN